ncbi:Pr6Pr family membrane protein, partial [Nocardiopsis sp. NPDC055824]
MKLPGASESSEPPSSKSLLPRVELTWTSVGRRWWMSVPGPVEVPKSPWDLAHGAVTDWYPYPFLDVTRNGYATAVTNTLLVVV